MTENPQHGRPSPDARQPPAPSGATVPSPQQGAYQTAPAGYGGPQVQGAGPRPGVGMGRALRNWWAYKFQGHGRASRSEYWWVALALALLSAVLLILMMVITSATAEQITSYSQRSQYGYYSGTDVRLSGVGIATTLITTVILLVLGLLTIPLQVRRLHDANMSGGFWFLSLIPFFGGIILLVLMCLPSNPQGQRFDTPEDIGRP